MYVKYMNIVIEICDLVSKIFVKHVSLRFEIVFGGWGFGDVGQVCDKCRYSLLCLFMCHRSRT